MEALMETQPRIFRLVNPANKLDLFAIGIDMGDQAITYRWSRQFGVHSSAETARLIFGKITELRLIWEEDFADAPIAA